MKLIALALLMILVATSAWSQIEIFGTEGMWIFDPEEIVESDSTIELYFYMNMDTEAWHDFDPEAEGLLNVGMMFEFSKDDPALGYFTFVYRSEYELRLKNYIVVHESDGDVFLLGGQETNGDSQYANYDKVLGTYLCGMEAYFFDTSWVEWFAHPVGSDFVMFIGEFEYGDHLWIDLPKEFFQIISRYYYRYH